MRNVFVGRVVIDFCKEDGLPFDEDRRFDIVGDSCAI